MIKDAIQVIPEKVFVLCVWPILMSVWLPQMWPVDICHLLHRALTDILAFFSVPLNPLTSSTSLDLLVEYESFINTFFFMFHTLLLHFRHLFFFFDKAVTGGKGFSQRLYHWALSQCKSTDLTHPKIRSGDGMVDFTVKRLQTHDVHVGALSLRSTCCVY